MEANCRAEGGRSSQPQPALAVVRSCPARAGIFLEPVRVSRGRTQASVPWLHCCQELQPPATPIVWGRLTRPASTAEV